MKISIIIPAYNVEKYIEPCLTSVVKQDLPFSDYEIIVLNDGSTDSTHSKIVSFAKDYTNFVIIDKANEGLGTTRNRGVDAASGEYVMFLDSDDTILENCLASIYSHLKNDDLDILEFNFRHTDEEGFEVVPRIYADGNYQRPLNVVTSGRDNLLYSDHFIPMVWTRLYRTELLRNNNLYMIHEKHEDENFTPRAFYHAERVKYTDTIIYYYLQQSDSIMGSYSSKNYFDTIVSMGLLKKFITETVDRKDIEIQDYLNSRIEMILQMIYIRSIEGNHNLEKELAKVMKRYNVYPFNPKRYKKYKFVFDFSVTLFVPYFRRKLKRMGVIKK